MGNAYIVDACRTPRGIGKVGKGALAHLHPSYLGSTVLAAMAERNNLNTAEVDDIIWGTSSQTGKQGGDLGRMAALNAGYDVRSSGVTLDRFCGSGITTVNLAAAQIMVACRQHVEASGDTARSLARFRFASAVALCFRCSSWLVGASTNQIDRVSDAFVGDVPKACDAEASQREGIERARKDVKLLG